MLRHGILNMWFKKTKNRSTVKALSFPGTEHENHDSIGHGGSTAWVIDGATNPLRDGSPDTGEFTQGLSESLSRVEQEGHSTGLISLLYAGILGNPHQQSGHSATIALSKHSALDTTVLVLGDAIAMAFPHGAEPSILTDMRLNEVAARERRAWQEAVSSGDAERGHALREELVRAEQRKRNKNGGYWVVADEPKAARQAFTRTFPPRTPVVLMSDGITHLIESDALVETMKRWGNLPENAVRQELMSLRSRVVSRGSADDVSLCFSGWGQR